ncbi:MAG: Fic family protein [Actinomycetota bacterium]|nr:Fic family protein [Actinomycetota bacterium]
MTDYLTIDVLLVIAERAIDADVAVRDFGLLESALARPQATVFGQDAYLDLHVKAGALLHSLCSHLALVDGNKRLAWAATVVFLYLNGWHVVAAEDDAYDLVIGVASGKNDVEGIGAALRAWSRQL